MESVAVVFDMGEGIIKLFAEPVDYLAGKAFYVWLVAHTMNLSFFLKYGFYQKSFSLHDRFLLVHLSFL